MANFFVLGGEEGTEIIDVSLHECGTIPAVYVKIAGDPVFAQAPVAFSIPYRFESLLVDVAHFSPFPLATAILSFITLIPIRSPVFHRGSGCRSMLFLFRIVFCLPEDSVSYSLLHGNRFP